KKAVARPRPYVSVPEARLPLGRGGSGSMPSSHTSTWFAATVIACVYFRKSWRFMLPLAAIMGFSRVYLGVHYPGDVVAGSVLGVGYAVTGLWMLQRLWQTAGRRWFPLWWSRLPSLVNAGEAPPAATPAEAPRRDTDGSVDGAVPDEPALRQRQ